MGPHHRESIKTLSEQLKSPDLKVIYPFADHEAEESPRRELENTLRQELKAGELLLREKLEAGEWKLTGIPRGETDRVQITDLDILKNLCFGFRNSIASQGSLQNGRRYEFVRVHPVGTTDRKRRSGPKPSASKAIRAALEALPPTLVKGGTEREVFETVNNWLRGNNQPEAKLEADNERPNQTFRRELRNVRQETGPVEN